MELGWRKLVLGLVGVAVLAVLNGMVLQKERLLADGQTVYLELAPEDPRSLMAGDYMRLDYAIAEDIAQLRSDGVLQGRVVVRLNDARVAHFERAYRGGELGDAEILLRWRYRDRIVVGANAFYFEEGQAQRYENAQYAKLKADSDGHTVLVGLVDTP